MCICVEMKFVKELRLGHCVGNIVFMEYVYKTIFVIVKVVFSFLGPKERGFSEI